MAKIYTENPVNYTEIESFVKTKTGEIKDIFFGFQKILFYDAGSFQRHSIFRHREQDILIQYFNKCGFAVFLTRSVLMDLLTGDGKLEKSTVEYIKRMSESGISVVLYDEETTYDLLSECFVFNETVNEYLILSIKALESPVSIIKEILQKYPKLESEILQEKNRKASYLYSRFFQVLRKNREEQDGLSLDLVCATVYMLSYLPGIENEKLWILTDDRGAAGKIDTAIKKISPSFQKSKIVLCSTLKFLQNMIMEGEEIPEEELTAMVSQGNSLKITVCGMTSNDIKVNSRISLKPRELAQKMKEKDGIRILF